MQTLTYDRLGNVIGEAWNGVMAYRYYYDASNQLVKTLDIFNKKMYNINRVGENVTSIEEYDVASINTSTYAVSGLSLVGTMRYSFDSDGKQFRKKYVAADGSEQKYVFEYQDEQNVAVQLPTGVVSHAKSDHLGRKIFDELQLGKGLMNRTFTYHEGEITQTHLDNDKQVSKPETTLVKQIEFADGRTIQYEYDAEERITKVIDSIDGTYEYTYDALGQLLTEKKNNVTVNTMTYDKYGNIATKNGKTYTYDATWKDKLLSTGNGSIGNYDLNGNPKSYLGNTLVWEKGRQLKQYGANTYKYNNEGIRIKKTTSSELHEYILDGTNIVKEIVTDTANCPKYVNEYLYDLDGTVCGLKHNGTAYYFYKNLQGDVIAITDDTGTVVARYTYDAWGKVLTVTDANGTDISTAETHIANINPFRYRSYYYDTETEFYYLKSRYYDSKIGCFINADAIRYISNNKSFGNLYSYCFNNPISNVDVNGRLGVWVTILLVGLVLLGADVIEGLAENLLNRVPAPEAANGEGFEVCIKAHEIALNLCHTCLVIFAENLEGLAGYVYLGNQVVTYENNKDSNNRDYFTIGAGGETAGFFGCLKNGYNRKKDIVLSTAIEMKSLGNMTKDDIDRIVSCHEYYDKHSKPKYAALPGKKSKKYNCNCFTHGLLEAANIKHTKPSRNVPGWDKPVPKSYFGIKE